MKSWSAVRVGSLSGLMMALPVSYTMLPGTLSLPSFMVTDDFLGSGAGGGVGAGVGVGAADATGGGGAGGGGAGGGVWDCPPIWACASQPTMAGAAAAASTVRIKGATIVRAIFISPGFSG